MIDTSSPRPVARWYLVAALASAVFMAIGCAAYLSHVMSDPASLPLDQQAALAAEPAWVTAAYAVAVWAGLAGAVLLVPRRKLAEPLLLASMIAVAVWFVGLLAVPGLRRSMSTNDVAFAAIIVLVTWTIYGFARHSRQRGWLR